MGRFFFIKLNKKFYYEALWSYSRFTTSGILAQFGGQVCTVCLEVWRNRVTPGV